jgi:hypothetical protein
VDTHDIQIDTVYLLMKKTQIFLSYFIVVILFLGMSTPIFASTIFSDSFTDSDNTELTSHNVNWVNVSGQAQIQNNELVANNPVAKYYWNGTYPSQNYKVCTDVKFVQAATNNFYLQYIRTNSAYSTWYRYYIQGAGTDTYNISLGKSILGNESILDSDTISASNNSVHNLCISANGSALSVTYDNSEVLSATDSSVTSGYAAIYQGDFPLDNFTIEEIATPEANISVSPSTGTKNVGQSFNVDVIVNGDSQEFNAARSTVTVSSNFTITGINTPSSDACNFSYTQTPTTSNPSFAGAIFGTSSTNCKVYTMTLTPNTTGTGTIALTNASIKAYADNSEIFDNVQNASFILNDAPTPTPTTTLEFVITNPLLTYDSSFSLYGTKLASITHIFVNGSDVNSSYPTSTTWQNAQTLVLGDNNFTLYGSDDNNNQTATQTVTINRHTLGDINGDGIVNLIDASLFAVDWDKISNLTYLLSDMNGDGVVNLTDLSILAKLES